jgi:hypothetical protein
MLVRRRYLAKLAPAAPATLPAPGVSAAFSRAEFAAACAVILLALGPCAVFLYANYTESLFAFLLALFLLFLDLRKWWAALAVAAIASSCRSQGVLFGPVLALCYLLLDRQRTLRGRLGVAILMFFLSGLGLLAYMIYLQITFGDPLAFMHAQRFWHVGINRQTLSFAANPFHALSNVGLYLARRPLDIPRLIEALSVVVPPVILLLGRRWLTLPETLLGWILWGLPYVSNCLGQSSPADLHWMSMGRFIAVVLPLPLILGGWISRRPILSLVLLPTLATFAYLAYLFGAGTWVG